MKITFTITPRNTSFPVLIINELEYPLIPSIPREPFYSIGFSLRTSDRQKGILNLSGVIRGKSNSPIDLIIKVYINGANKAPTPIPFSGNYSNKGTFIFTTNVSLPKSPTGFQGRRQ